MDTTCLSDTGIQTYYGDTIVGNNYQIRLQCDAYIDYTVYSDYFDLSLTSAPTHVPTPQPSPQPTPVRGQARKKKVLVARCPLNSLSLSFFFVVCCFAAASQLPSPRPTQLPSPRPTPAPSPLPTISLPPSPLPTLPPSIQPTPLPSTRPSQAPTPVRAKPCYYNRGIFVECSGII